MPAITREQFGKLNLMAGTGRSLETEALTEEDIAIWERDFALLCDDLAKLVDPELGNDLKAEKSFYDEVIKVAKGYFNKSPFGGLKSSTGQFGFRLITPQDLKQGAGATTPALYSWVQTAIDILSGRSYSDWGASGIGTGASAAANPIYACSLANKNEVLAFHRLLSYKPSPRVIHVEFNINDFPYVPYAVEPYSKITKEHKLFKIIPMPGRVILHPGGKMYITLWFDTETGGAVPPESWKVDVEIALFGLVFGQYDYLADTELV